ncbi:hypothetical protein ACEZCY_28660 [Streptacidiphilus sp. N1-12]|uniref:Uncharacterized protein n=2 Tax=Streptacidiphilus alkalitolerans TaxID=3342712 RepID=A0ABV6VHQ4_9ACTN
MDFDEVADQLYSLPPPEFTRARDTAFEQARAVPELALANRIKALRRPTQGAWLANLLVRRHQQETGALLDLGAELRAAQDALDGPELRALTAQRRAVVNALARQARAAATEAGHPVGEAALSDLEEHLMAVLADPQRAAAFAGGRLTTLHGAATAAAGSSPRSPSSPSSGPLRARVLGVPPDAGDKQAAARRQAAETQQEAKQAQAAADAARRALDKATRERERVQRKVEDLRQRLEQARDLERTLAAAERTARAKVEETDRIARKAQGRARDAAAHQQHLADRAA